jgi:hypothetical protein
MTIHTGNEDTVVRTVDGTPTPPGATVAGTTRSAGTSSRTVVRPAFGPVQIVVLIVGLLGTILGAVALARTGTHFSELPATHAQVAGMGFSALSAAVQLGAGVILLACSLSPYAARTGAALFGVASLVWGIVIIADTPRLLTSWNYTNSSGVVYVVVGAVLLLSALLSPVFSSTRREVRASSTGYDSRI